MTELVHRTTKTATTLSRSGAQTDVGSRHHGHSLATTLLPLASGVVWVACILNPHLQALASPAAGPPQTEDSAPPEDNAASEDSAPPEDSAPAGASVLDGVFTAGQASRGKRRFQQVCAACHETSEFSGGMFRLTWVDQTAGDLFNLISLTMPDGNPGSLSPEEYTDVVAFFLDLNGYPAGEAELPADRSALQNVRIEAAPAP